MVFFSFPNRICHYFIMILILLSTAFDNLIQGKHIKVIRSLLNITKLNSFLGNIVFSLL